MGWDGEGKGVLTVNLLDAHVLPEPALEQPRPAVAARGLLRRPDPPRLLEHLRLSPPARDALPGVRLRLGHRRIRRRPRAAYGHHLGLLRCRGAECSPCARWCSGSAWEVHRESYPCGGFHLEGFNWETNQVRGLLVGLR